MINGLNDDVFLQALRVLSWSNAATTILVHPDTGSVLLQVGIIPKGAYGQATDATHIFVNESLLQDPVRLAIVIVHELTHCIDYKYVGSALRDGGRGWASEINAHFNQGLIMRELDFALPKANGASTAFRAMFGSNTTFGNSSGWTTRKDVAKGIRDSYMSLAQCNDTSFTTEDGKWSKAGGIHYYPVSEQSY